MDGYIALGPDDLTTVAGVTKLNNMFQALFNNMPGDGATIQDLSGYGSPNGVVTASPGSNYRQIDGSGITAFWIKQSGTGNTGWGTASGSPYIMISETQPLGTNGGTSVTGSWQTRVLNTTDSDANSISSLSSNQITLPAGTYITSILSPFHQPLYGKLRLQNITDSTTTLKGQSFYMGTVGDSETNGLIRGKFTLSGSKALAVQYQIGNARSTDGLGVATSFDTEVYTIVELFKVA